MRKIIGAYHVATFFGWQGLVQEQCRRLNESGLFARISRLLVGVVGDPNEDISVLVDLLGKNAFVRQLGPLEEFEFPTLQWLYEEIQSEDAACWYAHTKGVSAPSDENIKWRMEMESVVFDQYEKCLDALKTYDTCGTRWRLNGPSANNPHYSGNFWWANSSYLRTLPSPMTLRVGYWWGRHGAEFWIGRNPKIQAFNIE